MNLGGTVGHCQLKLGFHFAANVMCWRLAHRGAKRGISFLSYAADSRLSHFNRVGFFIGPHSTLTAAPQPFPSPRHSEEAEKKLIAT